MTRFFALLLTIAAFWSSEQRMQEGPANTSSGRNLLSYKSITKQTSSGYNNWRGISSSVDGTMLAAAAYDDYIHTSTTSGTTWTAQTSAGSRKWMGVASSSDGSVLIAVDATPGYIWRSTNFGLTWASQTSTGSQRWRSVATSADGTIAAAGVNDGLLYITTNSGAKWQNVTTTGKGVWISVTASADGTKIAACATLGYVWASTNSGASWTKLTSAGALNWYAIAISADGTNLFAADYGPGNGGYIWRSSNGGSTWSRSTDWLSKTKWTGLAVSADGTNVVAGASGCDYVYTSSDSASSFQMHMSVACSSWNLASSSDGTRLAAAESSGYIWTLVSPLATAAPTRFPTGQPTRQPSSTPTAPSGQPTRLPTGQPSAQPTEHPTRQPSGQPSCLPSHQPTSLPSSQPSTQPTAKLTITTVISFIITGASSSQITDAVKANLRITLATTLGVPSKYVTVPILITKSARQSSHLRTRALSAAPTLIYASMQVGLPSSIADRYIYPPVDVLTNAFGSFFQSTIPGAFISVNYGDFGSPSLSPVTAATPVNVGGNIPIIVGTVGAGLVMLLGLLIMRRWRSKIAPIQEDAKEEVDEASNRHPWSSRSGKSRRPRAGLDGQLLSPLNGTIAWSELSPEPLEEPGRLLEGTYGAVFKATWNKQKVAVKIYKIRLHGLTYEAARQSLMKEADNLVLACDNELNDHIVKYYGIAGGEVPEDWIALVDRAGLLEQTYDGMSMLAIVTRWEEGGTLHDLLHSIKPCVLSVVDRIRIIKEVALGLYHLHECKDIVIVHGDLKPSNLLLSDKRALSVRLADFGLANVKETVDRNSKLLSAPGMPGLHRSMSTSQGVGTWAYMAPELALRRDKRSDISPSTDVYSFGTVMWEVLTAQLPWAGEDEAGRLDAIRDGLSLDCTVPFPMPAQVPARIVALVSQCLLTDSFEGQKSMRPSIAEALQVLEEVLAEMIDETFDIFISYNWGPKVLELKSDPVTGISCDLPVHKVDKDGNPRYRRQDLVEQVYMQLREEHYRVWFDKYLMGKNMDESMRKGVLNSRVVVVFMSREYATSVNCLKELNFAHDMGKPIVVVCTDDPNTDFWKTWKRQARDADGQWRDTDQPLLLELDDATGAWRDGPVARKAKMTDLFCSMHEAYRVDWGAEAGVSEEDKKKLTENGTAMPLLRKMLRDCLHKVSESMPLRLDIDIENTGASTTTTNSTATVCTIAS